LVSVWDLYGNQPRQDIALSQRDEYSSVALNLPILAFVHDDTSLLIKNYSDKSVRQLEWLSGNEVRFFTDTGNITCFSIHPDGKSFAVGTDTRQIIRWNTADGSELSRWTSSYGLVSLAYAPNGKYLASMDQDLSPAIWNLASGNVEKLLAAYTRSTHLGWSSNSQTLFVTRQPDQVVLWNLPSGTAELRNFPRNWVQGMTLGITPPDNSEMLLLGSSGRQGTNFAKLRLVPLDETNKELPFDGYDTGNIFTIYNSHRNQWLTIGMQHDSYLRAWNDKGIVVNKYSLPIEDTKLRSFARASNGEKIALSDQAGKVYLIETKTGKLQHTIQAFTRPCHDTEFTLDSKSIMVTDSRSVKLFDAESGILQSSYDIHPSDPVRTAISNDGTKIASLIYSKEGEDLGIRILEAPTGRVLVSELKLLAHQQNFYFSPDARFLHLNGNLGGATGIILFETASGKQCFQVKLPTPYQYITSLPRISPDGRWLAAPLRGLESNQYAVAVWRLGSTQEPYLLKDFGGEVSSCYYSPDSKQLLTPCHDSTILIWDMTRWSLPPTEVYKEEEYTQLWHALGSSDAHQAFVAMYRWSTLPQAATWLAEQIRKNTATIDKEQLHVWIKQLDSSKFAEREYASQQLNRHVTDARNELKQALQEQPSTEKKRRIEQILNHAAESISMNDQPLQLIRAIAALERMATPESLEQLEQLTELKDNLGQEAKEAALRLRHQLMAVRKPV
ncbi:MAG TPA: hypothetical protein PKD72_05445, partial [Gemmatales bacterium]|nr:hypothetical protein [Gemmatales bacterium]